MTVPGFEASTTPALSRPRTVCQAASMSCACLASLTRMQWAGKAGSAILDMGSPLQSVATLGKAALPEIGGFSILEADNPDALQALLDDHPHFHAPGDTGIEVLEFLPIPGM